MNPDGFWVVPQGSHKMVYDERLASEVIDDLKQLIKKRGDLPVYFYGEMGDEIPVGELTEQDKFFLFEYPIEGWIER